MNNFVCEASENIGYVTLKDVPQYVRKEADAVYERFCQWKEDEDCIVFPVLTDLHTKSDSSRIRQIAYTSATTDLFEYDFFANLGDIGVDLSSDLNEDIAVANNTLQEMKRFSGTTSIICKGNHDNSRNGFTQQMFIDLVQAPLVCENERIVYNRTHACGYLDLDNKGLRVYFLNSSDGETRGYVYTVDQIRWFAESLEYVPEGFDVVVLTHYISVPEAMWVHYNEPAANNELLCDVINCFREKEAKFIAGMLCDYRSVSPNSHFVGVVYGDRHFDYLNTYRGINVACTQGYGGISDDNLPPCGRKTSFDTYSEMLVDVVAICPRRGEVRYFRMGAGGADCDRGYRYYSGGNSNSDFTTVVQEIDDSATEQHGSVKYIDLQGRPISPKCKTPFRIQVSKGRGKVVGNGAGM